MHRFVAKRTFSAAAAAAGKHGKVCIVGASGGIGQPLALSLKASPYIQELSLYDLVNTPGVASDLSHINTPAKVSGFSGQDQMGAALSGASVVVIPAGVPRKPGMTRDDLFATNANIVKAIAAQCAKSCPEAAFLIISNPVNSTVPIFREVLKKAGVYNKNKLFGVTTLDVTRANTFVAENQKWDVNKTNVTVVGGHAGTTILPLLSQLKNAKFSEADLAALTKRIQFGGDEVVQAKNGTGSATLSMAFAGAHFANQVIRALNGAPGIVECTFVESPVAAAQGCEFFSSPVLLGKNGVEKIHPIGSMNAMEKANFDAMIKDLASQIQKGIKFANS